MRIRTTNRSRLARPITRAAGRLSWSMDRAAYCNISQDGPSLSVTLTGEDKRQYTVEISYDDLDLLVRSREYYRKEK